MNIDVFIKRRKELKLSQVKLCEDICTQATLSKFENNGRVPSLTILNKLCARLGLMVDDLYQDSMASTAKIRDLLDRAEKELMMENYQTVIDILAKVKPEKIEFVPLKTQFYYLRGLLNALTNQKPVDIMFDFSQILDDLDDSHQSIFTQLAYLGSGVMYSREKQNDKADFYFSKIFDYIKENQEKTEVKEDKDNHYLRILTLIFFTAEYNASKGKIKISDELVKMGIDLCSEYHVTYYLPRLKLQAAQNAISDNKSTTEIERLMNEALAFAHINDNQVVEVRVAALRTQFEKNK
ncbi:helix-turn-helix domain-containing protein [Companilactobacillus allii]|uniref:Transcriptional regulator n=1 Tax=Companilactobacillus allii TaxID=1847728 RepID=A0A1P8Q6A2_9LACO|nr:helix-turn-helix transcriptional regulator [Companilactobacillus allii]APX73378.1 transcriptional regulator [Companilactobacillus allii]USQ69872.1 helix-turn-helix domain-containing protein [Companilactobacillus allii]